MSNAFTLDDLNAAVEREFAPLRFTAGDEEFVLRNVMRLPAKDRAVVLAEFEKLEQLQGSEATGRVDVAEVVESVQTILKAVTDGGKGAQLVKILGGDLARNRVLLEKWTEATQVGEAQGSRA